MGIKQMIEAADRKAAARRAAAGGTAVAERAGVRPRVAKSSEPASPVQEGGSRVPPAGRPPAAVSGAARPLGSAFLLQVFVDQAEWLEVERRRLGLRSRAEVIRRALDVAKEFWS